MDIRVIAHTRTHARTRTHTHTHTAFQIKSNASIRYSVKFFKSTTSINASHEFILAYMSVCVCIVYVIYIYIYIYIDLLLRFLILLIVVNHTIQHTQTQTRTERQRERQRERERERDWDSNTRIQRTRAHMARIKRCDLNRQAAITPGKHTSLRRVPNLTWISPDRVIAENVNKYWRYNQNISYHQEHIKPLACWLKRH